jgi:hypothetical protein
MLSIIVDHTSGITPEIRRWMPTLSLDYKNDVPEGTTRPMIFDMIPELLLIVSI